MANHLADALVVSVAALLWLAFAVKAVDVVRHRRSATARMLAAILGCLALSATMFSPNVNTWLSTMTGVPNVAEPLARIALVAGACIVQVFLIHLTQQDPTVARRLSRRRVWPALITVLLLVAVFVQGRFDVVTERMAAHYASSSTLDLYLVVFLAYLGFSLVDLTLGTFRYSPAASGPVRTGLLSVAVGALLGLGYVAVKVIFIVLDTVGHPGPVELESILARVTASLAGLFVLFGALWPPGRVWLGARVEDCGAYLNHRRLFPLWQALYKVEPGIALDPPRTPVADALRLRDPRLRLYRRVIEIRDGWLAVRPYLDAEVAQARRAEAASSRSGVDIEAYVEAALLKEAISAAASDRVPDCVLAVGDVGGADLETEVAWFRRVARQYRALSTSPAPTRVRSAAS